MSEHNGDVASEVILRIPGRKPRCCTPYKAVLVLLAHCSPQQLQELKLNRISLVQHAMPVVEHDASEAPG